MAPTHPPTHGPCGGAARRASGQCRGVMHRLGKRCAAVQRRANGSQRCIACMLRALPLRPLLCGAVLFYAHPVDDENCSGRVEGMGWDGRRTPARTLHGVQRAHGVKAHAAAARWLITFDISHYGTPKGLSLGLAGAACACAWRRSCRGPRAGPRRCVYLANSWDAGPGGRHECIACSLHGRIRPV